MNKGFTLIELIVAISLLTIGTVGSFSLVQKTIAFSSISSSQLQASYLAQEGIEIIRNIRDTNYLQASDWDDGISAGADYRLDYRSESFPDVICGDYLKEESGFYICSIDSDSKFQRQITITKEVNKMMVSAEASWSERENEYSVLVQTELYNWR